MNLKIEILQTSDLLPYVNNSKEHPESQIKQIASSIQEFGFNDPIAIDSKTNTIIEGHGRYLAAQKLGITELPVIKLDHLSPAQQKAYRITHNKLTVNSDFDIDILKVEFEQLQDLDFDLDLTGFNEKEINGIFYQQDKAETKEPELPEMKTDATTKPGDLWQLGKHRLLCGDCTDNKLYENLVDGALVDQLVTDPPYGVDYATKKNSFLNMNGKSPTRKDIHNDDIIDYRAFFEAFLDNINFAMYNTIYIFMGGDHLTDLYLAAREKGIKFSEFLMWLKNVHIPSRKDYSHKHENIFYGWKGKHKFYGGFSPTVLEFPKPNKSKLHPTMKPLELIKKLIADGSLEKMIVYDPFLGSGTTLIAAEELNRICYGFEIDPVYCDIIIERWQNLTGEKAELITNCTALGGAHEA